jgi:hypothetical protein
MQKPRFAKPFAEFGQIQVAESFIWREWQFECRTDDNVADEVECGVLFGSNG